jgi:outer membrane lipoprotein carrier protein
VAYFRLLAGLLAVSAFAGDASLDRVLRQVEQRYNSAKTLQVLFKEEYIPPGSVRRMESGVLLLRKPGRTRWDYTQPQGKLIVSDGKFLWIYTPADNRVMKDKLRESEDMSAPLSFLLGRLHFSQEFRNLVARPEGSDLRVTAEPKSENLPYSKVEFVVTPENRIRELRVTGFDQSILNFTFDGEKVNPPLDGKLFEFHPPPGAKVEEGAQ